MKQTYCYELLHSQLVLSCPASLVCVSKCVCSERTYSRLVEVPCSARISRENEQSCSESALVACRPAAPLPRLAIGPYAL